MSSALLLSGMTSLLFGCETLAPSSVEATAKSRMLNSEYELRQTLNLEDYKRLEKQHSWIDKNGEQHPGFSLDYETGLIDPENTWEHPK